MSRFSLVPSQTARARAVALIMMLAALALVSSCTAVRVITHRNDTSFANVPAGRYTLDPHHWSVTFDVSHLGYSRFVMRFDRAYATLDWVSDDIEKSRVNATLDASSINTNMSLLDQMIAGSQMLDAAHYPQIRFNGMRFTRIGERTGKLDGMLTIRGRSAPLTLKVTFNGASPDPFTKREKLGFSATGSFNRSALGLTTWYPAVGDEVQVRVEAEFNRLEESERPAG